MKSNILALLCPEWSGPMMVFNTSSMKVEYANLSCLNFLRGQTVLNLTACELNFVNRGFQNRFVTALKDAQQTSCEIVVLVDHDHATNALLSCVIRTPRGLIGDILKQQLGCEFKSEDLVIIEWSTGHYYPEPAAINALAVAWNLLPSERRDLAALAMGHSTEEIADLTNSTVLTVRQRIKAILAKSNCSRQQELIVLIRNHCPDSAQISPDLAGVTI